MLNEVYLISSLPSLSFGQTPPIAYQEFINIAKSELSARSFKVLDLVNMRVIDGKDSKTNLKSLDKMQSGLLKDISEIRNSRKENSKASLAYLSDTVLELNPLDREIQIMQWQWETLDEIVSGKSFTLTEVIIYKLKLQLLIRMDSFSKERGEQVLDSIVNPDKKKED